MTSYDMASNICHALSPGRHRGAARGDDDVDDNADDDFEEIVADLVAGKNLTFGEGDEQRQAKAVERVSQGGSLSTRISRTGGVGSSRISRTGGVGGEGEGGAVGGAGGEGEGESGGQSKWGGTPVTAATIACFPRFSRAAGSKLTHLILSDNFLSESMMALLCTALRSMMTVTSLELERCGLGASGTPVGPVKKCLFLRFSQF